MAEIRSRLSVSLVVTGLIAVATVSMVVDRRALRDGARDLPAWTGVVLNLTVPVQRMIAIPVDVIRDGWTRYVALFDTESDNAELRERLAQLEGDNLQLREALVASGRLHQIAEMRESYEIPMLPSELVGVDVSPWFRSVLLDRGRGHGVRSGMPIISEQGVVGLVTATSSGASKAMLVLDRQSAIDVTVQRNRARGILRGRGTDLLDFEFVARDADVRVGDGLITSGLDGVYPKGLAVGRIAAVADAGSRLLQTAKVEPAVDFSRLEQVFVMLRRGPTMELLYQTDDAEVTVAPDIPTP